MDEKVDIMNLKTILKNPNTDVVDGLVNIVGTVANEDELKDCINKIAGHPKVKDPLKIWISKVNTKPVKDAVPAGVADLGKPAAGVADLGKPAAGAADLGKPAAGVADLGKPAAGAAGAAVTLKPLADAKEAGATANPNEYDLQGLTGGRKRTKKTNYYRKRRGTRRRRRRSSRRRRSRRN